MRITDKFESRAAEMPDAPAVADDGCVVTYAALNNAANALAGRLLDDARTGQDMIAYMGGIGAESITFLLACYKAVLATAMLDPAMPGADNRALVQFCDIRRIVCPAGLEQQAAAVLDNIQPLLLDREAIRTSSANSLAEIAVDPQAVANIAATSGSTGRPKIVPYSYLAERRQTGISAMTLAPQRGERVAVINESWTNIILCVLEAGACIEPYQFRQHGAVHMARWLRERQINRMPLFTALYRQLTAAAENTFQDIRNVTVVGEALGRADLEAFDTHFPPGSTLRNRFASTEHGTIAMFTHHHGAPITADTVPLGEILDKDAVRLVDTDGNDVPVGAPGEIVVSGSFIPAGYWREPDRSEGIFQPASGADAKGGDGLPQWSCHSGFMAYQDHTGLLHPLGRKDEQIKIRGYNVRPSAVEQAVIAHPAVKTAAVVAVEGPKQIRQLVCHFVPTAEPAPTPDALRAFLRESVPNYMVPGRYMAHVALPTTANGKVHRNALAKLSAPQPAASANQEAITGPLQQAIAATWAEVLGHHGFGPDDDFFDIGGDSLQAMAMVVAIEARLQVRLPFESLIMEGASLSALATRVERLRQSEASSNLHVLKHGAGLAPIYAMPVIGGHLSDYLALLPTLDAGQQVLGVHPRGMTDKAAPDRSIAALGDYTADLMASSGEAPFRLMGYSFGAYVALEAARALVRRGHSVSHLVLLDPGAPWRDPLRHARSVYRSARDGGGTKAWIRVKALSQVKGNTADMPLTEVHLAASLAYSPSPLPGINTLVVFTEGSAGKAGDRQEWQRLCPGPLRLETHTGNHQTMMRAPHAAPLAQRIQAFLSHSPDPAMQAPLPFATAGAPARAQSKFSLNPSWLALKPSRS